MFIVLFAGLVRAVAPSGVECESSYIYCNQAIAENFNPPRAWVDGLAGCKQFFIDRGEDPDQAICEDNRCKNTCPPNNCDLNDSCVVGVCYNGCTTGSDCKSGNVFTKCNNYLEIRRVLALPTYVSGPNVTRTFFNLTFCENFCATDCDDYTGFFTTEDTCSECTLGTTSCANDGWCDYFGQKYAFGITNAFFPGDPVFDLSRFQKRRCESRCDYDIGDSRAGIYVNRINSDIFRITNMDPIPAPGGRMPIVEAGKVIHALPGRDSGTRTCQIPSSNVQCSGQDKYGLSYRASFVTQMDFGITAAYCVSECPRFAGQLTTDIEDCRECATLALNRCQWKFPSSGRDTCDAFAKYLPGDPYNLVGWNVCVDTCLGAVNGSGWSPCGGGGCCDRCDKNELSCLWQCSLGPKCNTESFYSSLDPGNLIGVCEPLCDPVVWSAP